MEVLSSLLQAAEESKRLQLWLDVKRILLQHQLQLLLQDLRTVPLPLSSQAGVKPH